MAFNTPQRPHVPHSGNAGDFLEPALVILRKDGPGIEGLRANRCKRCKITFFPPRQYCAKCTDPNTEEILLHGTGKLVGFSTVHRKPPFALIEAPYVVGEVDVGQGVFVAAVIRGTPGEIRIGATVELAFERVTIDPEGNQRIVYVYVVKSGGQGKRKNR